MFNKRLRRTRVLIVMAVMSLAIGILISAGGALAGVTDPNASSATKGGVSNNTQPGKAVDAAKAPIQNQTDINANKLNDGFDALPNGLKAISYSTLVQMGKVKPVKPSAPQEASDWVNPFRPLLNIVWGVATPTSGTTAAGEPAAGMHPTDPNKALVSGNFSLDNTTNGGTTWTTRNPPNSCQYGDVVNVWLGPSYSGGNEALITCLNPQSTVDFTCGRSTDGGVNWSADAGCGASVSTMYFDDRQYMYTDRNPASPYYQRVYLTEAIFDAGGSGSFNSMTFRWSSDGGHAWNPPGNSPLLIIDPTEFQRSVNHNEYPSIGIQPNGTIGYAWHRGMCCGGPSPINSPNKVMFARSTDGGVSFPFTTTVVTVPLNQTVPFNSTSPFGTRWSDTPNITADPVDGTFYTIWTQYRTASTPASAAIYLSKSTDNGATWSTPVIPFNNPNANIFQGFGWLSVTPDHTVHLTYLGGTTSNTVGAQFYLQSTDAGATWSAPFQLSSTFSGFAQTTDYEANDVGGYTGGAGSILTTWAQTPHYARIGNFVLGTPTPTHTPCSPPCTPTPTNTSTRTATPTSTPSPTATVCGNYNPSTSGGAVVAGTTPIGINCDDCVATIALPFTVQFYNNLTFNNATVSSNGTLQFVGTSASYTNDCLPSATLAGPTIYAHWDDMNTSVGLSGCSAYPGGCGVFTTVEGSAPNRIFDIEWRAVQYANNAQVAHFEVRLYENTRDFDIVIGQLDALGVSATIGSQDDTGLRYTQFSCDTSAPANTNIHFAFAGCGPSPTPTNTCVPGACTNTPTRTYTLTRTNTPTFTITPTITNSPTNTRTVTPTATCVPGACTSTPTRTSTPCGVYRILLVGADCGTPPDTLRANLLALAGVGQVDIFDAFASTPTLAQLQQYDIVVPFSNCGYADPTTLGDNLADYQDSNGIVVGFNFDWYGGTQSIAGRWATGGYSPFDDNAIVNFQTGNLSTCTFAPLCGGVTTLTSFYRESMTLASGATLAGTWDDSTALMAYKGRAIGVSAYVGDNAGNWSGDFARIILNAGTYLHPVSCGTNTPTVTGTPPTATRTRTPTHTPTITPTPCGATANYTLVTGTDTLVPGTTDIGNNCDDCTTTIALPFTYNLYGVPFNSANVSSNGTFQFVSNSAVYSNGCLPDVGFDTTIFVFWDDLYTADAANGEGIFTSISGSAPNRIFNVEWRTVYCCTGGVPVNDFELRLYEGQSRFDIVYGTPMGDRSSATIGVQNGTGAQFTEYECNISGPTSGLRLTFTQPSCGTATPTPTCVGPCTSTPTATRTPTRTNTPCGAPATWTTGPNVNEVAMVRAAGVWFATNSKFYAMGGRTSDSAGSDLTNPHVYDPNTGTWANDAAVVYPDNQVNNMACADMIVGGTHKIYCVGGSAAGATTATARVFAYDPVAHTITTAGLDTWPGDTNGTTLPGGYAVVANKLYILGGFNINTNMITSIYAFDPTAASGSQWTLKGAQVPNPNGGGGMGYIPAAAVGNVIYTGGGSVWDAGGATIVDNATSFSYNTVADALATITPMPAPGSGETRAVNVNGQVWVIGGGRTTPNPSANVMIYDPANPGAGWTTGSNFTTGKRNAAIDKDPATGKIYLAGGYTGSGIVSNTFQIYTPAVPCGTATPTPAAGVINGHLTWQSVTAPNRPSVTGTLILCVSGSQQRFGYTTDTNGNFTVTTNLPNGVYHWQNAGGRHITNSSPLDGTDVTISGGQATQEFGLMKSGNTNPNPPNSVGDNIVNASDFTTLKNQFGSAGIKSADFDYNQIVNASDFTVLKNNFGTGGHTLTCP